MRCDRCLCWCSLIFFTWVALSAVSATSNGGSYVCKNTPWTYGERVTVEFRIDRSKYPSSCPTSANGLPSFQSSIDGIASYNRNCTLTTDIRVNCSFPAGALGCGCVNSGVNGFYILEYNFIAHPDYNRWWRVDAFCLENFVRALDFTGTNCSNITVVGAWGIATTTETPTTTVSATTNGGSYVCKNTPWTEGEKVTIEFRINRSKFPSSCPASANSRPTFESSIDGTASYKPNCTVPTSITTGCSFPAGALGCGCVNSDDDGFYVIQYNFIAAPDYDRWWRADIACIDSTSFTTALSFTGTDCDDIPVSATTNGGSYVCKNTPWTYGEKATIELRIDRSKFPSLCTLGTNGLPNFQSSTDSTALYKVNCLVPTDIRVNCSFPAGALGCGCVNSNDNGFYVVEYNFIAAPDYDRWWRPEIPCFDSTFSPALNFTGTDCDNITVSATTNGGSYVCKNTPWTDGEKVTIELRVDRSKFPSSCPASANSRPFFESSIDGIGTYKPNCTVPTSITTGCSFPAGALGCGCVNSDDDGFYVIQYNFIAAPDYDRWWKADISCIDSSTFARALDFTGTNCSNITVGATQP